MKLGLKERWYRYRARKTLHPIIGKYEAILAQALDHPCQLQPVPAKGGLDHLFHVTSEAQRIAMLRVLNPRATKGTTSTLTPIRRALEAHERLTYEYACYQKLAAHDLSPRPIWHNHEALAVTWLPYPRASDLLRHNRAAIWWLLPTAFTLAHRMHALEIVHMDLNFGNLLVDLPRQRLFVIDFEYRPVAQLNHADAGLCDFLRLIHEALRPRRGGSAILRQPERWQALLTQLLPATPLPPDTLHLLEHFPNIKHHTLTFNALR